MQRRHIAIVPILIALIVMAYKYFIAPEFVNPETGRVSHLALSAGQEASLGLQTYQEVLSTEHVIAQGPEVEMINRVVKRLISTTGAEGQKMDWQVSVVQSDQVNAFCLPGGKIVVYTGILPVTQGESGLATVLGHEMAHATSHHGAERMFKSDLTSDLVNGVQGAIAMSDMDTSKRVAVMAALGVGAKYGVQLPFSRKDESEADAIGLMYMSRAGYDPHEAINFWQRMTQMAGSGQPAQFMSDHPSHENRVAQLQQLLPKAMEEYHRSAGGQTAP